MPFLNAASINSSMTILSSHELTLANIARQVVSHDVNCHGQINSRDVHSSVSKLNWLMSHEAIESTVAAPVSKHGLIAKCTVIHRGPLGATFKSEDRDWDDTLLYRLAGARRLL